MRSFILLFTTVLIFSACGGPSATHYADKFCKCSEELGKATVQLQTKRIDQAAFDKVRIEQEACMGTTNPLAEFKDPKKKLEFEAAFLNAIFEKCPSVARNMGFKE